MWLFIYIFLVAFIFSPGVLMPISRKYNLKQVAAVHALVIALVLVFTSDMVMRHLRRI